MVADVMRDWIQLLHLSSTIIGTDGSKVIKRGQPCAGTDLLV
jgi:hypothetical protein